MKMCRKGNKRNKFISRNRGVQGQPLPLGMFTLNESEAKLSFDVIRRLV